MTTADSAREVTETAPRLFDRVRASISRDEFFAGLFIVGCANGLGASIIRYVSAGDWSGGVQNVSVIVWFACFVGLSFFFRKNNDDVGPADVAVGLVFLILSAAPASEMNWLAVTGLCFYILLFTKDASGRRLIFSAEISARKRGALVLLALTVPMLWSRLLFSFIAKFFLEIDASLVGWLLRTPRTGNVLRFADGSGEMVILPACSSLANVSLAFLCWVAIAAWVEHRRSWEDLLWCLLACLSVVAANVVRISIMGLSHWHYLTFHFGWGAMVVNMLILVLIIGFSVVGVRRELFSRI
jgi:hypothetical protein